MSTAQEHPESPTFSERLKTGTWQAHGAAEAHGFSQALLSGSLPREGYVDLVAQHHFVYVALEEVAQALADHPVGGAVHFPELRRVPALERDLAFLLGPDWRDAVVPLPATRAYAERIRWTAEWPAGFVAHHYTRYLGDLSGGQFIRRVVQRAYGLDDGSGLEFYVFDRIGSLPRFKNGYRAALDALDLDEDEQHRAVEEARLAYRFNSEMLADLDRSHTSSRTP
ncbi:biliverdin-producing heme oxygenase [Thermobifida halotolerans]|uniref:Biliverdin-producing heme oxygenase n=1 Tax=Thermobifida halotolerans TaxID=483545 RepID=A0A399FYV4_9ACTN|nr:biliverdin-producing heme oxygenase [Thermobifida halotolerans]UOE18078.1 biliverdin-producing heme oxygenase [Thermobifida halotolerans]